MAKTIKEKKMVKGKPEEDPEFEAMKSVYASLKELDTSAQNRVLDYVCRRLSLKGDFSESNTAGSTASEETEGPPTTTKDSDSEPKPIGDEELDGISPVAQKWMRRNGLNASQLSSLFSLGFDEIDLVAKKVPGNSTRQKLRSVLLLQGAASYLGSGTARVTYEKLKETSGHYNAYDGNNFAAHMKSLLAEASGTKEGGYVLTGRGLTSAIELIKNMTTPSEKK